MNYEEFLRTKLKAHQDSGFIIDESLLNEMLFPFQKFIVKRALKTGKYAIFADCGLGKTPMQLEWANQVVQYTGKPVLILAPLAVAGQTIQEGKKFNTTVEKYSGQTESGIYITNYEQLENIDCSIYSGIVLDESSILKNFEGRTKTLILEKFKATPYKLCCTATPSPNDPMEMGNHSEFLDVMPRNQMLAQYFVHDGGDTAKWRLKGHSIEMFYKWIGSWAIMLNNPGDIGFIMDGYNLPKLNIIEHRIVTPKKDNGMLFNDSAISATDFNGELRRTKKQRMELAASLAMQSDGSKIVWVKQNEEADLLQKLLPSAIEVRGNDTPEYKERNLLGFANNDFETLITKAKIAQFGLNYQNCNTQIFPSPDFSFESFYQQIRRSYRFGQTKEVNVHVIVTDTMQNVKQSIERKQKQFRIMQDEMSKAVNVDLNNDSLISAKSGDIISNEWFTIKHGDCVQLIKDEPDESWGLSVFSPPFADLYTYSSHMEDMGNSKDWKEFIVQFTFLIKELYRVMKSGRNVCVHCMDLPIQKGKEGVIGLRDFSGMILSAFSSAGFIYASRITIWKDPVVEMQRTKALGLLHKQVKKDSTMSRVGIPDYVLIFRKDGERKDPVKNTGIPVDLWQKIASPVWMDIDYGDTLQYMEARDGKDEKHICPLQLQTIERLILLYSNPGDSIGTPFMGIGSEVYQSVKMGRKGRGFELKKSYFDVAKRNCNAILQTKSQLSII